MRALYLKSAVVSALVFFAVDAFSIDKQMGDVVSMKVLNTVSVDDSNKQFCSDLRSAFETASVTAEVTESGLPVFTDASGTFEFGAVSRIPGAKRWKYADVTYHTKDGKSIHDDVVFHDNDDNTSLGIFGPCMTKVQLTVIKHSSQKP